MGNHKADKEELNRLIEEYQNIIREYTENVSFIERIADHINKRYSLNYIDVEAQANQDIAAIRAYWEGMVEADSQAKDNYSNAQAGLSFLNTNVVQFLETLGKGGENLASMDVEKLTSSIMKDENITQGLLAKVESGTPLTYSERELFYQYIQTEVVTDDVRTEAQEIVSMMNDEGINDLKEHINAEVLVSEEALDQEIGMLEAYLYSGNLSIHERNVDKIETQRLRAYIGLLKNYKSAYSDIKDEAEIAGKSIPFLANVEKLNFVESTDPMKLQFDSELAVSTAFELGDPLTREEFLEAEFWTQQRYYTSKSTQYLEHYADEQIRRASELEYGEQLYNYNSNFVSNELKEFMISKLGAGYKSVDMVNKYEEGKSDIERSLTQAEAEGIASTLAMEVNFLEQSRYAQGDVLVADLQPTPTTYAILSRWKEVHYLNPEIPYPENEIDLNDWKGIRSFKLEHQGEIEENFPGLFAYIDRGTTHEEVENLVIRKSGGNQ